MVKKIGIDARLYSQTGVGVCIRNLLFYLQRIKLEGIFFYVYLTDEDYEKIDFTNQSFIKKRANYHWHTLDEQIGFLKDLNKDSLDLMHFTYFSFPAFYRKRFIATVHDLTLIYFKTGKASTKNPLLYEIKHGIFKYILKTQIKHAAKIITPSATVKQQLLDNYGNNLDNKIIPIYEGVNHEITEVKENDSLKNKFTEKFFIYVGNFYPHKNVESLVRAFSIVKENVRLILLGPDDFFLARIRKLIVDLKQEKKIIYFKTQSINDLVFFYKNAEALIHPSLSEGFGLPLLEAAHFNLPVIGSNIPIFKEILDSQYLSFDPNSLTDMTEKINEFIQKKPEYNCQSILKKFSFEEMAKKTLECYLQIINAQ